MRNDIERILISEEELQEKVSEMGKRYPGILRTRTPYLWGC